MPHNKLSNPIVLLVEDNPAQQTLTRRAFERAGLVVDLRIVADGEQAMHYLRKTDQFTEAEAPRPDLILLDLNLPMLDGRQVLREAKKRSSAG